MYFDDFNEDSTELVCVITFEIFLKYSPQDKTSDESSCITAVCLKPLPVLLFNRNCSTEVSVVIEFKHLYISICSWFTALTPASKICALNALTITVTSYKRYDVANQWQFDCLFGNLFGLKTKETSKLFIAGILWGESTGCQWIPHTKGQRCGKHFHVTTSSCQTFHDDVIKWKHFPRYWPFVRGIHRWPVNSPHKGQWRGAFMFSLISALNKRPS